VVVSEDRILTTFLHCLQESKKPESLSKFCLFMFLNLLAYEEELWIEWTCLVNFLAFGFGSQVVLL